MSAFRGLLGLNCNEREGEARGWGGRDCWMRIMLKCVD